MCSQIDLFMLLTRPLPFVVKLDVLKIMVLLLFVASLSAMSPDPQLGSVANNTCREPGKGFSRPACAAVTVSRPFGATPLLRSEAVLTLKGIGEPLSQDSTPCYPS